jgi:DNA polymerase I-like protein with 3'-5' exonuclease and polymerase domains
MKHERLLYVGTQADAEYLPKLKSCLGGASAAGLLTPVSTLYEVHSVAKAKHATAVITSSAVILDKLVSAMGRQDTRKKPSVSDYAGSVFTNGGLEFLILNPVEQLYTVNYGEFLTKRFISKLTSPESWFPSTEFKYLGVLQEKDYEGVYEQLQRAEFISIDIETFQTPPSIRCVGYTAFFCDGSGNWTSISFVIPCSSLFAVYWIRKFNATSAAKCMQNGKYDLSYLQAYNAAPVNYLWDTIELFHSWYSELPKDLGSLNAFFVRNAIYWKDLAETNDLAQYYRYCALDTWATGNVLLAWHNEAPQWARDNYANTFPLQFPCHMAEMRGLPISIDELRTARTEESDKLAILDSKLNAMLGKSNFNTNSPIQMKQLLAVLGCGDLGSTNEKDLKKASLRHPLNERILGTVLKIRKQRKLISTYLVEGKEFYGHLGQHKDKPTILFALNPHGTDTGRLASKEHHFWCGLQIQNIPRGTAVKRIFYAADGFAVAECDLEQAESRDTAHIAGDESLIAATGGTKDFHSLNASAFFGIPYASIYDDAKRKTLDKALRDLSKRVNHGANYNMGWSVLIDTMGEDKIREAQKILNLPKLWSLRQVAEYLLAAFHKTYPKIAGVYYKEVISEVRLTSMLSSKALHGVAHQAVPGSPLVRYCFGKPWASKQDLNAYVAHPPQSLNAMTLNRAYMKVFYEIALHPDYSEHFKLGPQIHDSILFQFRKGHTHITELVKQAMEIPVTIKGYDKVTRTFTVPAAIKAGKDNEGARRWSETE